MIAFCIESSHAKGMGHLFRALNFADFLDKKGKDYIFLINNNSVANSILKEKEILFENVCLQDTSSNWEQNIIDKYAIEVWVNDRLDTSLEHAQHIVSAGCKLVTFDDLGEGARFADLNISPLLKASSSKKNLNSLEYLILNKEIDRSKRKRTKLEKIIVTMGGSDTYGITLDVVRILKKFHKKATILVGPSFEHMEQLKDVAANFEIKQYVPSLMQEFSQYDVAITAGGVTPFEANASGLPCIIIATEFWEIDNAKILADIGSSVYAGYRHKIDEEVFKKEYDIARMSNLGLQHIDTDAVEKIYAQIEEVCLKKS